MYLVCFVGTHFGILRATWAEDMLKQMTLEQKIGQLIVVAATENPSGHFNLNLKYLSHLITRFGIGGIIFFGMPTAKEQCTITRYLQSISKIPLLIMQDAEWGLGMRIEDCISFPHALTLGAITNNDLIYKLGFEIGRQCARMGIHINGSPVADILTEYRSVIGMRSFGDNPINVATKSVYFMHGLQDAGIIACAKHFPGHGNTSVDSHDFLPIITKTRLELENNDIVPFQYLIASGIKSIMIGHLAIPALDNTNIPVSLSPLIVDTMIRQQYAFDGLIMPDALRMTSIVHTVPANQDALYAFIAGHDILLSPTNTPQSYYVLLNAARTGIISETDIDKRVYKILQAKEACMTAGNCLPSDHLEFLWRPEAYMLQQQLYEHAITLVYDTSHVVPLSKQQQYYYITLNNNKESLFIKELKKYYHIKKIHKNTGKKIIKKLKTKAPVILPIIGTTINASILPIIHTLITDIQMQGNPVILVLCCPPFILQDLTKADACLVAYESCKVAQEAAARALAGIIPMPARLPITIKSKRQ
jgi:beta-glucosidase-like glycosyl hydrolase